LSHIAKESFSEILSTALKKVYQFFLSVDSDRNFERKQLRSRRSLLDRFDVVAATVGAVVATVGAVVATVGAVVATVGAVVATVGAVVATVDAVVATINVELAIVVASVEED
jgi:hypothetical protein